MCLRGETPVRQSVEGHCRLAIRFQALTSPCFGLALPGTPCQRSPHHWSWSPHLAKLLAL